MSALTLSRTAGLQPNPHTSHVVCRDLCHCGCGFSAEARCTHCTLTYTVEHAPAHRCAQFGFHTAPADARAVGRYTEVCAVCERDVDLTRERVVKCAACDHLLENDTECNGPAQSRDWALRTCPNRIVCDDCVGQPGELEAPACTADITDRGERRLYECTACGKPSCFGGMLTVPSRVYEGRRVVVGCRVCFERCATCGAVHRANEEHLDNAGNCVRTVDRLAEYAWNKNALLVPRGASVRRMGYVVAWAADEDSESDYEMSAAS